MADRIEDLKRLIDQSTRIVAFTGAGISTDSGIPDYRGPEGIWTTDPELERIMTMQNYQADSDVRQRYWARGGFDLKINEAKPNAGHLALAKMYKHGNLRKVITQNVDGLHQASGIDDENVIEAHGTVRTLSCMKCGHRMDTEHFLQNILKYVTDVERALWCLECNDGLMKQDVIMFGEELDPEVLGRAYGAAQECSLMLVLGTSLEVGPINSVLDVVQAWGGKFVIINRDPTAYDKYAELVIYDGLSEVLTELTKDLPDD